MRREATAPLWIIVVVVVILRIPSLFEPYWYGDEAIYLTLGEGIRQGLTLYKDIFDHKTPLIYFIAALAGSLYWFKFILLVSHSISVVVFWKLAQAIFKKGNMQDKNINPAVILSTSIFALFTTLPMLEGNIVNSELLMLLPTLGAFYTLFKDEHAKNQILKVFGAGILLSIAILLKVPAIFDALALVIYWTFVSLWKETFQSLYKSTVLLLGIALPVALTAAYFFSQGAIKEYLQAGLSQNFSYINTWNIPKLSANTGLGLMFRAQVLAGVLFVILATKKFFDKTTLFASIWLALTCFSMLLSGRPYPHYAIQVIPAAAILIANLSFGVEKHRFLAVPFLFLLLSSLVFYKFYYYPTILYYQNFLFFVLKQESKEQYFKNFDQKTSLTYKLSQVIIERTSPKDRVFIWGTAPETYALSRRLPPTRYITSFHVLDFKGEKETMLSLAKSPPKYIVLLKDETRILPGLANFVQENYSQSEIIDGNQIWRLKSS